MPSSNALTPTELDEVKNICSVIEDVNEDDLIEFLEKQKQEEKEAIKDIYRKEQKA